MDQEKQLDVETPLLPHEPMEFPPDYFESERFLAKKHQMIFRSLVVLLTWFFVVWSVYSQWDQVVLFPLDHATPVLQALFLLMIGGVLFSFTSILYYESMFLADMYFNEPEVLLLVEETYRDISSHVVFVGLIALMCSTFLMFSQAYSGFTENPVVCQTHSECQSVFANYAILWVMGLAASVFALSYITEFKTFIN